MALYRQIFIEFWKDPKVTEEMSAEDRYALLYLLTNPHTTQIGIYQITKRQMAFDLGYSTESVGAILERFEKLLGIIKYTQETREIAIKNWGKYNLKRGGKPIMDCIRGELEKVKDKNLIEYVAGSIPNETIKNEFLRYVNDTFTISGQEEEQEQEKEKEKEEEQPQLKKDDSVVVDKIKSYFNLDNEDIKKVANAHLATGKDISYLIEKLEIVKNTPNVKSTVGLLLKAIQNDYRPIISNNTNVNTPNLKGGLGMASMKIMYNGVLTDTRDIPGDELERMILEKQATKWNNFN